MRILHPVHGGLQGLAAVSRTPALTPDELDMHGLLYRFDKRKIVAVSDEEVILLLRKLRADAALAPFHLWLVGSRLEPGNEGSDIDLVLAPRVETPVIDELVEAALWHCRNFGLHAGDGSAQPCCLIDPCFRSTGPALTTSPLAAETVLQTSKLFSPKLARLTEQGQIRQYRRFGRFSIEYLRRAGDTGFYAKLPRLDAGAPYLRPAVEILCSGRLEVS